MTDVLSFEVPNLPREKAAIVGPLATRVLQATRQMLMEAPLEVLQHAAAAATGAGSLATLVSQLPETSPRLAAADPEAAAVARAAAVKQSLLASSPTYSTGEAAKLLGVSAEAVRKRRVGGRLVAVPHANDWRFPVWQFAGPTTSSRYVRRPAAQSSGVLPGLEEVLAALPIENVWVRLELLTAAIPEYGNRSVVQSVREGRVDEALNVVLSYGEQGY